MSALRFGSMWMLQWEWRLLSGIFNTGNSEKGYCQCYLDVYLLILKRGLVDWTGFSIAGIEWVWNRWWMTRKCESHRWKKKIVCLLSDSRNPGDARKEYCQKFCSLRPGLNVMRLIGSCGQWYDIPIWIWYWRDQWYQYVGLAMTVLYASSESIIVLGVD